MNFLIRKASMSDLDTVKSLTEACAKKMISDGIYQWNDHYPSKEIFRKDIKEGALYVWDDQNQIRGCVMFSPDKDEVSNSTDWLKKELETSLWIMLNQQLKSLNLFQFV